MFIVRRYRKRLDQLVEKWTEYRGLVINRMGAPDLKGEEEKHFLKLKGKVAEDLTSLSLWLSPNLAQEVQAHLRGINQLLGRYPTLFSDRPLDEQLRADFERDWHDHFLFFNRLKGIKPEPKPRSMRATALGTTSFTTAEAVRKPSGATRLATVIARLLFLLVLGALFVRFIPWERLHDGSGTGAGNGLRRFLIVVGDRVKETFSGAQPIHLGGLLDPVVEAYGSEITTILVAVFLLVVGYFIFGRMK